MKIELRFSKIGSGEIPPWWYWVVTTEQDISDYSGDVEGWDFTEGDAFQQAMDAKESLVEWYWSQKQERLF